MNAIQVYRAVSDMISQGEVESEAALRASLNRALDEIGRLSPRKQFFTLRHFRLPCVFRLPLPREVNKESPLTVSALFFEGLYCKGSGRGELLITSNQNLIHRETLDGLPFSLSRTLFSLGVEKEEEVTLLFRSEDGMVLEELVLYEKLYRADVPCEGRYVRYEMPALLHGFISFSGECRKNGLSMATDGEEVILEKDAVCILSDRSGVYEIGCFATPREVEKGSENESLDLTAELLPLVPLLTAYYACLEAEDARADEFLARYREARDEIRKRFLYAAEDTVSDVMGW